MADDQTKNDFASLFEASTSQEPKAKARRLQLGERCQVVVVQVGREVVFAEVEGRGSLGQRIEAYFQVADLRGPDGLTVKPGDRRAWTRSRPRKRAACRSKAKSAA
jgi:hypothetical protein